MYGTYFIENSVKIIRKQEFFPNVALGVDIYKKNVYSIVFEFHFGIKGAICESKND